MTQLSRRDVLRLLCLGAGGLVLSSCYLERDGQQVEPIDRLFFNRHPLNPANIENNLRSGLLRTREFGELSFAGQHRQFRMVVLDADKFDYTCYGVSTGDPEASKIIERNKRIYDKTGSVILLQKWTDSTQTWEKIDNVASIGKAILPKTLNDMVEGLIPADILPNKVIEIKVAILSLIDPNLTDEFRREKIRQYFPNDVEYLLNSVDVVSKNLIGFPEAAPTELANSFLRSIIDPVVSAETYNEFAYCAARAGIKEAIFVPKKTYADQTIEAFTEMNEEIPSKPEKVIIVKQFNYEKNAFEFKVYVKHQGDKGTIFDNTGRYFTEWLDDGVIARWEEGNQISILDRESDKFEEYVNDFKVKKNLLSGEPEDIYEIDLNKLRIVMVSNRFIGKGKARLVWALPYEMSVAENIDSTKNAWLMLGDYFRDKVGASEDAVSFSDSWVTDVTEILQPMIEKGIYQVNKIGLLSPIESISFLLKGFDSMQVNLAVLPESPMLMYAMLSHYLQIITGDVDVKQMDLAIGLKNVPVWEFEADLYPELIKLIGEKINNITKKELIPENDHISIQPLIDVNGQQAVLNRGAIIPYSGVLKIRGEYYIMLLQPKKDEYDSNITLNQDQSDQSSSFFQALVNKLGKDSIRKAYVIKWQDAVTGLAGVDPDPILREALQEVLKGLIVSATVVAPIVAPEAAGLAVTAGGLAVQGKLAELAASLIALGARGFAFPFMK